MPGIGNDIQYAKRILEEGGLVAIPTETVYGLAANALNPVAVAKIFEAKNRPSFDPLIVHVAGFDDVHAYTNSFPDLAQKLAKKFWPGPLTLLLPKADNIPDIVTSGMPEVAIRHPKNTLTQQLLESIDFPLVAPSANPFGYISPTSAQHVHDQLAEKVDYILDGGDCEVGVESTIVGFSESGATIYRTGGLDEDAVKSVTNTVEIRPHSSSNPKAPGMLKSHYAPHTPFKLLGSQINTEDGARVGYLTFNSEIRVEDERIRILSPSGDLREAAKNLFRYMRELDGLNLDYIFAETVPNHGLGKAINDRLRRAATD